MTLCTSTTWLARSRRLPHLQAADIPLGELVALKQDGSTSAEAMKARAEALRNGKRDLKRKSKHHPSEMPSKKPVKVLRDTMQTGKREVRDPRFDDLTAGKYTDASFKKRYAFVYDEKLPQEKRELAAALKRAKNDGQKAEIKDRLARVTQDLKAEQSRRRRETVSKEMKAKEHAAVAAGKQPFYLKKSERRRQELVSKFEELKETGQLEKYMAKRRKKNAAKDHRYLPAGRRDGARGDE